MAPQGRTRCLVTQRHRASSSRATSRTISQPARRECRLVRPPSATIARPAKIVAREERHTAAQRSGHQARNQRATKTIGRATLLGTAANGWRIQAKRHFTVDCGRQRQSGPRPDTRLLCHPALEGVTRYARTDSPRRIGRKQFSGEEGGGGGAHGGGAHGGL
ncbi:hypothetical protein F511_27817 [Dorcoceras hygrometricum]|uniref:Uncharacterized protein n=1 Tax=Dorcoceras hygrometricum TaxID=472368 RepID=A0A2Z7CSH5_9LAMI|nr:hypothetical protein F511_27817 [Dorcoceras hygrometricum]